MALQHDYYRTTRDRLLALAKELELDNRGVASTPGARGERNTLVARIGKVQNILHLLLFIAGAVDVIGMVYVLTG